MSNKDALIDLSEILEEQFEQIEINDLLKLDKDLKDATKTLTNHQISLLVSLYYDLQKLRIASGNQEGALKRNEEPHVIFTWLKDKLKLLELQIVPVFNQYVKQSEIGKWLLSIHGIGPVLAAGLIANLDVTKAKHPSCYMKYIGMTPNQKRVRGQKLNYNPFMKTHAHKIATSFLMLGKMKNDDYGKFYHQQKNKIIEANERGDFKETAALALTEKNYGKETESYKAYIEGKLPKLQIHFRAQRYMLKIFFTHLFYVSHEVTYGKPYELGIYPLAHMENHSNFYEVIKWKNMKK